LNEADTFKITCPGYGKVLYPKKLKSQQKMRRTILPDGVFTFLMKQLSNLGLSPTINIEENIIEALKNGQKIKIVIVDYCFNTFLFNPKTDNYIIRIVVDEIRVGRAIRNNWNVCFSIINFKCFCCFFI